MVGHDPDVALLRRAGDGDERAAGELYDRHARRVFAIGLRLLADRPLAEDLVQETFVRVWRSAARFDDRRGTVRAYVNVVARNAAVDMHRRRALAPVSEVPEELEDTAAGSARYDRLTRDLVLRDALAQLPTHHRRVLELAYDEDLTQETIGERLGVPAGTVKSRTFHALRALRAQLGTELLP